MEANNKVEDGGGDKNFRENAFSNKTFFPFFDALLYPSQMFEGEARS
jgi:hypothetical protein